MKTLFALIATLGLFCAMRAEATVTNFSGNEAGFNSATSGLPVSVINFDDLNGGDIISNQYNPPVVFSTNQGYNIVAGTDGYGTMPLSGPYCAVLPHDPPDWVFGELSFNKPVWGIQLWVLDVTTLDAGLNVTAFDRTHNCPFFQASTKE